MFTTIRTLGIVLAATATLAGCNAAVPTLNVISDKGGVVTSEAARGKVRVALTGGLGQGYKTLATRADVARLKLVLSGKPGTKPQVRELGPKDLAKPMIYVDFDRVSAGKASLAVSAFDAQGAAIGKGESGTAVSAGKTSTVHVKVKLDPSAGEGRVDAVITFEESITPDPTPRDGEEAFRKADRDGDGWLSLGEYSQGWPHAWGPVIGYPASPAPMRCPVGAPQAAEGGTTAAAGVSADQIAILPCWSGSEEPSAGLAAYPCEPPIDQARQDFRRRDVDRDGRLSLAEFLGMVPTSWCDSRFIDLDRDADDRLSFNEWAAHQPIPMIAPGEGDMMPGRPVKDWLYVRFKGLDVSGDGLLDRDEFCNGESGPIVAY